jgi:hypothetical protein
MSSANLAGFSLETVVLEATAAKAIRHQDKACRSRALSVSHSQQHSQMIVDVACSRCATPQRCTAPVSTGKGLHGRAANVLTPAGWRCFECATAEGFWTEGRDGFAKLLVGWE